MIRASSAMSEVDGRVLSEKRGQKVSKGQIYM